GGGSKGAFAVGAIEVLRQQGITFDLVTGTSTGALIAPMVATDEIPLLRTIYSSVRTENILLRRAGVVDVLAADSIFDTAPLRALVETHITDARYQRILGSRTEVELCTTNLQTGDVEYFNPRRSGPGGGALPVDAFQRAILASASQPVLMPAVRVRGTDQYVDGGVREVTPLRRALDLGATTIYAIALSPEREDRQDREYLSVVDTLLRALDLLLTEVSVGDLDRAEFVNRVLAYLGRVRANLAASGLGAADVDRALETGAASNPLEGRRGLKLIIIRPATALPVDGLTFSPLVMSQMMTMGSTAARKALGIP
ncbi:MAG TPA: patatin-like phospholipase family protein, partial [Polyangia bacterium]|nr:patatin-like phospholipase family protein [Polyangia bacterium]